MVYWFWPTRDDHGAGGPEWTPAGVSILGWSRSRVARSLEIFSRAYVSMRYGKWRGEVW